MPFGLSAKGSLMLIAKNQHGHRSISASNITAPVSVCPQVSKKALTISSGFISHHHSDSRIISRYFGSIASIFLIVGVEMLYVLEAHGCGQYFTTYCEIELALAYLNARN